MNSDGNDKPPESGWVLPGSCAQYPLIITNVWQAGGKSRGLTFWAGIKRSIDDYDPPNRRVWGVTLPKQTGVCIISRSLKSGCGSVRLEHTVRDREIGGSNPPAPTELEATGHVDRWFSYTGTMQISPSRQNSKPPVQIDRWLPYPGTMQTPPR